MGSTKKCKPPWGLLPSRTSRHVDQEPIDPQSFGVISTIWIHFIIDFPLSPATPPPSIKKYTPQVSPPSSSFPSHAHPNFPGLPHTPQLTTYQSPLSHPHVALPRLCPPHLFSAFTMNRGIPGTIMLYSRRTILPSTSVIR